MACSIKKVKHLFWYMVLATVVVLIWSLQTMVKMIVALQYAPRNAQVKRQLRPSSYTTEEINGGDEERTKWNPSLWPQSEKLIDALVAGNGFDEDVKFLLESAHSPEQVNSLEQLTSKMHQKAGDELSKLTMKTSDKEVLSRLAAAKKVPAMKNAVDTVEKIVLLQNWIKNGHDEKVFNMLIADKVDVAALLADPLFQSWMELFKQIRVESPIPPLFKMLMGHFEERVLTQQLYAALNTEAAKETADILTSYQILYWHDHKNTYPDDRVFTLLGVKDEGVNMFESLKWNSWISFMKGQEGKSKFSKQALALPLLRKHFNDDFLVKLFDDAIKKKKKSAIYYKRSLNIMQKNDAVKKEREDHMRKESVEKEGPVTRNRLRNGGEAPAPTKRQRKDDGQ